MVKHGLVLPQVAYTHLFKCMFRIRQRVGLNLSTAAAISADAQPSGDHPTTRPGFHPHSWAERPIPDSEEPISVVICGQLKLVPDGGPGFQPSFCPSE